MRISYHAAFCGVWSRIYHFLVLGPDTRKTLRTARGRVYTSLVVDNDDGDVDDMTCN